MGKKSKNRKSKRQKSPKQTLHRVVVHKKSREQIAPPLSAQENEHLTYMRVKVKYDEFRKKRVKYNRWGILFILISALIFLSLMFSFDSKIEFLTLWIITTLLCIAVLIRTDYRYNWYKELLGLADEYDKIEYDFEDENEPEPQSAETFLPPLPTIPHFVTKQNKETPTKENSKAEKTDSATSTEDNTEKTKDSDEKEENCKNKSNSENKSSDKTPKENKKGESE